MVTGHVGWGHRFCEQEAPYTAGKVWLGEDREEKEAGWVLGQGSVFYGSTVLVQIPEES